MKYEEIKGIKRAVDNLGRVVIPKELRKEMNINEGDYIEFILDKDNNLYVRKSVVSNG